MPNDEFQRKDHICCVFCNVMNPSKCSSEHQMAVIMIEKCPGFITTGGLLSPEYLVSKYKLEVPEDEN